MPTLTDHLSAADTLIEEMQAKRERRERWRARRRLAGEILIGVLTLAGFAWAGVVTVLGTWKLIEIVGG